MSMTELSNRKTSIVAFVLLYIAYCISYIDRAAISLALAQIGKDFNLQAADLGIIISAFFLGYAAMQVPGGWLSDRFCSKYVVIVTIVMWSLFTAFTSLAWSLTSLIAIRFIFGIAEGGFRRRASAPSRRCSRRTAGQKWRGCCCRRIMPAA
jgi:MFS family permease